MRPIDPRRRPDGYTLVALVVTFAVMNILIAAALPYWSSIIRRDKEAELIFRGLQYAEAIRLFQKRTNRLPNTLDELIEVNPRSIRRLWKDPMSESGEWRVIRLQAGAGGAAQQGRDLSGATGPGGRNLGAQNPGGRNDEEEVDTGRSGELRSAGPIIGVRSTSEEGASRSFMGSTSYADWRFTIEVIPTPVPLPESLLVPRPTSDWIGKPFREGIEVRTAPPGQNLTDPRRQGDGRG